jgi:hypothetical protein
MTVWERRIIGAFTERYPASAAAAIEPGASARAGEDPGGGAGTPRPLRIRPDRVFPGIDRASPDDRESFLEAAESLERRGLLSLVWARHRKGEVLSTLVCRDPELLYELAGKASPKTTAEKVRAAARAFAAAASKEAPQGVSGEAAKEAAGETAKGAVEETVREAAKEAALFLFVAENFTPLDAAGGIDAGALEDLARLTRFLFGGDQARREHLWRNRIRGITTRALSTALYSDSKRLEYLLNLFSPLLGRARRQGISVPDFSLLDRSFPETFIAGNLALDFEGDAAPVNTGGRVFGLPLETILKLRRIQPLPRGEKPGEPAALMIENKETFFALAESTRGYACFLYVGGHPNRAVRAIVSLLSASGFTLYHAGDLDPDGILILQELTKIAGKEIVPLRMDAATFDQYLDCGKKLEPSALRRTALIGAATRSIPGIPELIRRIEETGMGVEQEIINYRDNTACL